MQWCGRGVGDSPLPFVPACLPPSNPPSSSVTPLPLSAERLRRTFCDNRASRFLPSLLGQTVYSSLGPGPEEVTLYNQKVWRGIPQRLPPSARLVHVFICHVHFLYIEQVVCFT